MTKKQKYNQKLNQLEASLIELIKAEFLKFYLK